MTTTELLGILSTVIASAVGVAAWVTWRISKHSAELVELRRDVDRLDGAQSALSQLVSTGLEKQGGRLGELERSTSVRDKLCDERHKATAGQTV